MLTLRCKHYFFFTSKFFHFKVFSLQNILLMFKYYVFNRIATFLSLVFCCIIMLLATHNGFAQSPSAQRTTAIALIPMGSTSLNAFGGFVPNKHTLAYNPELNLLVFGHRGGGAAGSNGNEIAFARTRSVEWTRRIFGWRPPCCVRSR